MSKARKEKILADLKYLGKNITEVILPVVGLCGLSGVIVGLLVGFFNYGIKWIITWSKQIYLYVAEHLAFLPLLLSILRISVIVLSIINFLIDSISGST